jgi:hypothetical protein
MTTPDEPPDDRGGFMKFLARIAGCCYEILRQCPPKDRDTIGVFGWLVIGSWCYQTAIFTAVGHLLFAGPGEIRVEIVLAAIALATFIQLIDNILFLRSGWEANGIESLRTRGGLDIKGPNKVWAALSLCIRGFLALAVAGLTGIVFSVIVFYKDITARIDRNYLQTNSALIGEVTPIVDADIKRRTDAVATGEAQVAALAAQTSAVRQNQIDPSMSDPQVKSVVQEIDGLLAQKAKAEDAVRAAELLVSHERGGIKGPDTSGVAGAGPRYLAAQQDEANAKTHAQEIEKSLQNARGRLDTLRRQLASASDATKQRSDDQLPAFESALAAEQDKLGKLKDELARAVQGRNEAIRVGVESSPRFVKRDDGFLGQIRALESIAEDDPKIAAIVLLIEFASTGFELAAVMAKTLAFIPTAYADILAAESYERTAQIADGLAKHLNQSTAEIPPDEPPPNDNGPAFGPMNDNRRGFGSTTPQDPFAPGDLAAQPVKRPRGRPRKSPLNGVKNPNEPYN